MLEVEYFPFKWSEVEVCRVLWVCYSVVTNYYLTINSSVNDIKWKIMNRSHLIDICLSYYLIRMSKNVSKYQFDLLFYIQENVWLRNKKYN